MSEKFKNDFIDFEPIMDSIYGIIKISPFEKKIISTKEMQRLRGIKQLGFVNLVYPDAEHSRFAHSLGVSHQAKMIIQQVSNNISASERYQIWRNKFVNGKNVSEIYKITDAERIVIAAAALLHDLPHAPFSHEIENSNINSNGIPVHDDYKNNPTFYLYLFNTEKSDLAKIIDIHNESFWKIAKDDERWGKGLQDDKKIDREGYVTITEELKLPILGVMIFEIMLFDKMQMWLKEDYTPNDLGVEVCIDESGKKIKWGRLENWFRPYRKDIIANTICSDLLDYLQRDGRNTGILSSLDLKFFDRMTIAKAIPEETNTLIPLSKIPDFCEHIVFDIYDHKRGIIRQSVITEIISFLQQRYLLSERVYEHRVVEGARSMLREAARLLTSTNSIKVSSLHETNTNGSSPINDEAFFSWALDIKDSGKKEIVKAKQLIKMLRERRIFREVIIIDGLGQHKGTYRGSPVDCKTLADVLLNDTKRNTIIENLNKEIIKYCNEKKLDSVPNSNEETLFTIGVREWGKRYKIPRVLMAKPLNHEHDHDIEIFPLSEGRKLPAINDRLESMKHAYNSLWKVFLFLHPFFHHKEFVELHRRLAKLFLDNLYSETNIKWRNSIENYDDLLPTQPIDINAFALKYSAGELTKEQNENFLMNIISIVNDNISTEKEEFKLKENNKKSIRNKLEKNAPNVFRIKRFQEKVANELNNFSPEIKEAARDKEESIINQLVSFIKDLENNEGRLL